MDVTPPLLENRYQLQTGRDQRGSFPMLILSRHQGESLILSEGDSQITVSLLKVENEQLKIAISTPDEERMIQQELLHLTE